MAIQPIGLLLALPAACTARFVILEVSKKQMGCTSAANPSLTGQIQGYKAPCLLCFPLQRTHSLAANFTGTAPSLTNCQSFYLEGRRSHILKQLQREKKKMIKEGQKGLEGQGTGGKKGIKVQHIQVQFPCDKCDHYVCLNGINKITKKKQFKETNNNCKYIYALNINAPNFIKQTLQNMKYQINIHTTIVRHLSATPSQTEQDKSTKINQS